MDNEVARGQFDLIIQHGRVVDPETGLDDVRSVGIRDGQVAAIASAELVGEHVIDAHGMVVAPGFIDLHAHGQQLPAAWMQAFDGVTTALELESGVPSVDDYYRDLAAEGRPIHYGASASWASARIEVMSGVPMDRDPGSLRAALGRPEWQRDLAEPAQLDQIVRRTDSELEAGGLGVGVALEYGSGAGRKEYYEVARLAGRHGVPTFTHIRSSSVKEPGSSFEALQELISLAAVTDAHMHICHLNSSCGRDIAEGIELVRAAQRRNLAVTTEAYPYGAGSSMVGSQLYRGDWLERWGVPSPGHLRLNGVPLTQVEIDRLQAAAPDTPVVMHYLLPDEDPRDRALLDLSVLEEGVAIASDGMPWLRSDGAMVEGDVWPLPDDAHSHPRSAGCFARFVGSTVRERGVLTLLDAIRKASLVPAQILEASAPAFRRKGRLQVGTDADIVVFDLDAIADRASFERPAVTSQGVHHLVVAGVPVISNGKRVPAARPGIGIRRA
jgi:N-acyl-D-glutamate deacylase